MTPEREPSHHPHVFSVPSHALRPAAAGALVFVVSAVVLVIEILGERLLAPYVGVSLQTYTAIIGTVLAGISFGTWLGGRMADRWAPRTILGPLIALGGTAVLFTVPIVRIVGTTIDRAASADVVAMTFTALFVPAAILSTVNPIVAKLQLSDLRVTGSVVGQLSALATAGAIVGTFATGFFLVNSFPTGGIVTAIGIGLVIGGIGLSALLRVGGKRKFVPVTLAVAVCGASLTLALPSPCDLESSYYCLRVVHDDDNPSGRYLVLDELTHSYTDVRDPTNIKFGYTRIFASVADTVATPGQPVDALHLGGGGFTIPRYVAATRPGSYNEVLEIDPAVVVVAKDDFGVEVSEKLRVRVGDARVSIAGIPDNRFDVVFGDAFGDESVPWHLTTREFLTEVKRTMKPDGVFAENVIDRPPLRLVRAQAATLAEVFPEVAVVWPVSPTQSASPTGNFVVLAGNTLNLEDVVRHTADRGTAVVVYRGDELHRFIDGQRVLTDDFAPADQLISY